MEERLVVGALLGVVGLGLGILARRVLGPALRLRRRGVQTTGTVVGEEAGSSGDWYPIVRFTPEGDAVTSDGRVVTFTSPVSDRDLVEGTRVTVTYDPEEPTTATIATGTTLFAGTALAALACVLVLLGVLAALGVL